MKGESLHIHVDGQNVKLAGSLTEAMSQSNLEAAIRQASENNPLLQFDFEGLERANSVGLRIWLDVVRDNQLRGWYIRVPEWFVDHFNCVDELLNGGKILVKSVFAPYTRRSDGTVSMRLLEIGKDVPLLASYENMILPGTPADLQPDFIPGDMFDFVSRFVDAYRGALHENS